jgi:hypothetical protein
VLVYIYNGWLYNRQTDLDRALLVLQASNGSTVVMELHVCMSRARLVWLGYIAAFAHFACDCVQLSGCSLGTVVLCILMG